MINGIEDEIYKYVNQKLDEIEEEFNIKILYAVESGSRGWGFANDESDYDIRFIYIRPLSDYLSIVHKRDVIDINDLGRRDYKYDLDFSGWDITKTLQLHRKSNPSLREYIVHNMVYRGDTSFLEGLPEFDLVTLKQAYGGMTYSNWNKYVKGDEMTKSVTKRYCYCIRQILAWILIDEYNDPYAPINIDELFKIFENKEDSPLAPQLLEDMHSLVDYYRDNCSTNHLSERAIMNLSTWVVTYLDIMKTKQGKSKELPDIEIYNQRFKEILTQTGPYGLKSDIYDRWHLCKYGNHYPSYSWCDKGWWNNIDSNPADTDIFCEDFEEKERYYYSKRGFVI